LSNEEKVPDAKEEIKPVGGVTATPPVVVNPD
jgi:hypothetical protein